MTFPIANPRTRTSSIAVRRTVPPHPVTRPPSARPARMTITPEEGSGSPIYVPWAPTNITMDGLAGSWETLTRPGLPDLLVFAHQNLRKMQMTLPIADKRVDTGIPGRLPTYQTAGSIITLLRQYAAAGTKVRVAYSTLETGSWRITDMSLTVIRRDWVTDEPTQASVELAFTQASDIVLGVGPVSGGLQSQPAPNVATATTTRYYTVVEGDTLWTVSITYFNTPDMWRAIGDSNGIVDARTLPAGTVLRIPQ